MDNILNGMSAVDSIIDAGYNFKTRGSYSSAASMLLRKQTVAAYLVKARSAMIAKREFGRDEIIKFAVDTLKSTPADANMENPLCEVDYVGKDGDAVARFMPKAKALERLSKILGLDAPKKVEVSGTLQIIEYDLDLPPGAAAKVINDTFIQEAVLIEDSDDEEEDEEPEAPVAPKPKKILPKPKLTKPIKPALESERPKKLLKRAPLRR